MAYISLAKIQGILELQSTTHTLYLWYLTQIFNSRDSSYATLRSYPHAQDFTSEMFLFHVMHVLISSPNIQEKAWGDFPTHEAQK